jgi:hypothetical protein
MGKDRKTRLIKLLDFLKQTDTKVVGGLGLGGGIRTLYRPLSILHSEERALKSSDLWVQEHISKETLYAKNRLTSRIVNIPLESLCPSLRRHSGIDHLNITETSDFIVTDDFASSDEFFEDKKLKQRFKTSRRSWKAYLKRRQGSVFVARKFDLSAPGTRLVSFYSSVLLVPGEFWLLRNLSSDFSKIMCLWFNSTPNLVQMFLNRTETRGAWMKTDISTLRENYVLDPRTLESTEKNELLDTFNSIATHAFPNITEQLRTVYHARKKIDTAVLKSIGFDENEVENILSYLYPALHGEIEQLKAMMKG